MDVQVFGENRYRCFGCGSCCYGHAIELVDEDEVARIVDAGARLGVEAPVVGRELRFEDHRCVFHGNDRLCRIHTEIGGEVKPLRCQLWPLKLVKTEGEHRFGLDPGCLNTWRTWRDAAVQELPEPMVTREAAFSPQERTIEQQMLALAAAPATVPGILTILSGGRDLTASALPAGMAERIAVRAKATRLGQLLDKPELGDGIREPLAHLPSWLDALDPSTPPTLTISSDQDAFVREVVRRKLWLREAPVSPATHGLLVLTLVGGVVCGWADPTPEVFGPALAAWTRLMRFQAFWLRIAPELETLRWICTGRYAGALTPDVVIGG